MRFGRFTLSLLNLFQSLRPDFVKRWNGPDERARVVERLVFRPTKLAAFWCAGVLAAMHHGHFNAYAAYAILSLLIVLVVFLLFQTS